MTVLPRLVLVLQALISAGTFLVAKDATAHLTPLALAWLRIVLSAAFLTPIYFAARRRPRPGFASPSRREIASLALLGVAGIALNQTLFLEGIHLSSAINAALLYSFTPALVLLMAVSLGKEKLTAGKLGGVALAIAGVALVVSGRGLDFGRAAAGDALVLVAVIAWSAYTLGGKPLLRRHDALTIVTWTFWFGAAALLAATPWALRGVDLFAIELRAWVGVLYLSVMTSIVSYYLWYWALRRMDASRVAVFGNLQAPLTAILAWLFLGDVPGIAVVAGGILVLLGVTLVQVPGSAGSGGADARPRGEQRP